MIKTAKKSVLGKGLDALIPQKATPQVAEELQESSKGKIVEIEVTRIKPNKGQPRVIFDQEKLDELCQSIRELGVIQPILLSPEGENFRIVYGERRFRAVKMLGHKTIPAIVQDTTDQNSHLIALIENIQRENLNAIEEAEAYTKLMSEFHLTQEEVALKVGKSRSAVANLMRLLKLPAEIQNFLIEKKLTMGHIRTLLAVEDPVRQMALAKKSVVDALSVRELEKLVYAPEERGEAPSEKSPAPKHKPQTSWSEDPHLQQILEKLQHKFMCKVEIEGNIDRGNLVIHYHNAQDFQRLLEILGLSE